MIEVIKMSFDEMFATLGNSLFYGGLLGMAASVLLGIIVFIISALDKKRVKRKIELEFSQYSKDK